jgi:hypothetical protein
MRPCSLQCDTYTGFSCVCHVWAKEVAGLLRRLLEFVISLFRQLGGIGVRDVDLHVDGRVARESEWLTTTLCISCGSWHEGRSWRRACSWQVRGLFVAPALLCFSLPNLF